MAKSTEKKIGNSRKIVYLAGFLFSVPLALTSYINSSFLELYISANYVGAIYVISSIITILLMLDIEKVLMRFGNRKTTLYLSLLFFISLILLAFGKNIAIVAPAFLLYFFSSNALIATLDIFVEDFSKNKSIGKFRGMYLMILSVAWVLAQTISGSIIAKSSYSGIYLFSSFFMLLVAFIFIFFLKKFKDPVYKKFSALKTLKFFIRDKSISKIYLINLILKFFFAWMVVYTPIYLHEYIGFGWDKIGIIFSIMLLPFVFIPYPLGKISDQIGEKKILLIGFLISALFVALIPLLQEPKVWLWAMLLFMTRVGAATIEIMSESYFFKSVDEENADAISFFRNTSAVSFIIAPAVAIPILLFVPGFKFIFFILASVMLLGLFITLRLKDVK